MKRWPTEPVQPRTPVDLGQYFYKNGRCAEIGEKSGVAVVGTNRTSSCLRLAW